MFDNIDLQISRNLKKIANPALRLSLAIIFIWFGILKPFGLSAAEPLVLATVDWMPVFSPQGWLVLIGWWEVAIGLCFLSPKTVRIALVLLAGQMVGTFMPLVTLPEVTFPAGHFPYAPTVIGQYIIKNLVVIAAALAIGASLRKQEKRSLYPNRNGDLIEAKTTTSVT